MRLLHFVPRESWPLNTGARLRNYHLARQLSRHARLTFLGFTDEPAGRDSASAGGSKGTSTENERRRPPSGAESALEEPASFYERIVTVARERGYTPWKILRGALGQTPLPVLNYTTEAMKRKLAQVLAEEPFELVQVESIHLADYLPVIRAAGSRPLIVCDWHNIESELMHRYSEHAPTVLHRAYARKTSKQLASLERRALDEFDAHIVVSDRERDKLLSLSPQARLFLIENGVDTQYYSETELKRAHDRWAARRSLVMQSSEPSSESSDKSSNKHPSSESLQANRILFVGSMDYHANVDGVVDFGRRVWPLIHDEKPELLFTIVGRDPSPEVLKLASIPGIEVTGTVEDVRPYYREALAAVIPLRVGGGSRLKILEAMAAGIVVVSTRLGAEGIEAQSGENIILTETNDQLHRALLDLIADSEKRCEVAAAGRVLARARYDWTRLGDALYEKYERLLSERHG